MLIKIIALIIFAYLVGSVPFAYIFARRARGINLKQVGTGNAGMSNLWHSTSKWLAIPVIILDTFKGAAPVWVAQALGMDAGIQVLAGLAAISGHNWPVFLKFSGGRGILASLGVSLALPLVNGMLPWALTAGLVCAAVSFILHASPLGVGIGVAILAPGNWAIGGLPEITLGYTGIFILLVIRRLTAPRTPFSATISPGQLLLNRLIFDRDTRHREDWVNRGLNKPQA